MKSNIRYSIISLLFWIIGLSISLTGFIVLLTEISEVDTDLWYVIVCGILSLISIIMLWLAINNVQWFDITDGYITVYSPFRIVKRVHLSDIKIAFKIKASIFNMKAARITRVHMVLCLKKSIIKANITDAYNSKKNPYIIIPYTTETENFICSEYNKVCDDKLIIK